MSTQAAVRRLSAILVADVCGYARLVETDEAGTRARIVTLLSTVVAPAIEGRGGRIVKTMGDGVLAELTSATAAVEAAAAIQARMARENADAPSGNRIDFRIGVHLGDVIVEGDDIHGEGVNVAARLEALADPGGVCLSGAVADMVRRRLPYRLDPMGPQALKNIAERVPAYRLVSGAAAPVSRRAGRRRVALPVLLGLLLAGAGVGWWGLLRPEMAPAAVARMALPLPDRPSIAVLPLRSLAEDPGDSWFADGLTEDLVTRLASFPTLFVIARESTRGLAAAGGGLAAVAEDLGVRYLMEGSVRRSPEVLRVSVRLVDALAGRTIWGETYDRVPSDVFALQDEITREVTSRLVSNVMEAEHLRLSRLGTRDVMAYDAFLRGWQALEIVDPDSSARAADLFAQAIAHDPDYARAMAAAAMTRAVRARFGWSETPREDLDGALDLIGRAVALAPDDGFVLRLRGSVLRYRTEHEAAAAAYEAALALIPSDPDTLMALALTLSLLDRGEEAVAAAEKAFRLNPHPPPVYHSWFGIALFSAGRLEEAIASFERFVEVNPRLPVTYTWLTAASRLLGRVEEADRWKGELLARQPGFTISGHLRGLNPRGGHRERLVAGLTAAGLPD